MNDKWKIRIGVAIIITCLIGMWVIGIISTS